MSDGERGELRQHVEQQLAWCNTGSRAWSFAHHGTLGLAAVLSAGAAVIAKLSSLSPESRGDWTVILAGAAAMLATIGVSGGFERKWRTNRVNRGRCRRLLIELGASDADLGRIRSELVQVVSDQDGGIIGQQSAAAPHPARQDVEPRVAARV
jgi:hypothetical protein